MPRRTDNLYANYKSEKSDTRSGSRLLRAMFEWTAVAVIVTAGAAVVLAVIG